MHRFIFYGKNGGVSPVFGGLDMKKLWMYIAGCIAGIAIIIWMLVLIFVNNSAEPEQQKLTNLENPTISQNSKISQNRNVSATDNKNNGQTIVDSDNMEQNTMDKMSYYLRFENDKVVIYREPDKEFYDYADIKLDVLPPEIKEQIKLGMYIEGEERLYDFLQTYSS